MMPDLIQPSTNSHPSSMKETCCRCGREYKNKRCDYRKSPWSSTSIPSLQNRCKECYQRGYDRKLAALKRNDPSRDDVIYRLDERNLVWTEPKFINQCQACRKQIVVSMDYLEERDRYILCKECDPSNYCRQYYWSCGVWRLNKIRVLIRGMHRWVNPNHEYNEAYSCRCDKCLILESKETELTMLASAAQTRYSIADDLLD